MKSTETFDECYENYIFEMTSGDVVGGSTGGFNPANNITSVDSYAPGDVRIATPSKIIQKRKGVTKMKLKKKRKK
jgi:hypothetical protein